MNGNEPTAIRYIEHSEVVCSIAAKALKLDTQDATALEFKISLGLSLQAAELAGKGILRALELSPKEIRKEHSKHDILSLFEDVVERIKMSNKSELKQFERLLSWRPVINEIRFATTIKDYFKLHFSRGASAFPRSYFYPDQLKFPGPNPPQTLHLMVEHLINQSRKIVEILNKQ